MSEQTVWIVSAIVIFCLLISVGLLAHSIRQLVKMCWPSDAHPDWDTRLEDDLHE